MSNHDTKVIVNIVCNHMTYSKSYGCIRYKNVMKTILESQKLFVVQVFFVLVRVVTCLGKKDVWVHISQGMYVAN